MAHIITAVFPTPQAAKQAISEMKSAGIDTQDISALAKDSFVIENGEDLQHNHVKGGSVGGALTGGVLGILFGILAAPAALVVPGLGPMLVFGPMTVWGITGAVTGGLLGALTSTGYPETVAADYETEIKQGGVLLAVQAQHSQEDNIKEIMRRNNGNNAHVIHKSFRT
jgi:uncharacterized membrane protein